MRKVVFNDGEEARQEDYNAAQHLTEQALQDALYEMYGRQSGFVQGGFFATPAGGMDVALAAGLGYLFDASEADADRARYKVVRLAETLTVTVPEADPVNPRIDLICVAPARLLGQPEDRAYMDAGTEAITTESLNKRDDDSCSIQYVEGTPAPSPAEPAVPAGHTDVVSIYVAAGAATVNEADLTDRRYVLPNLTAPRLAIGSPTLVFDDFGNLVQVTDGANTVTLTRGAFAQVTRISSPSTTIDISINSLGHVTGYSD